MLRVALFVAVMVGVLGPAAAGDNPKPADDLAGLQGNWKPLQCESEGQPMMPTDLMKQVTVVFDKNEYHLYFVDKGKDGQPKVLRLALANVALDPAAKPKAITFEFAEGPMKGQQRHGIYELAGNQLKMCYGPADKPRPTEFKSPAGSGYFLETWARQAK
jgi:uncharacterized protein (TIGR03067 family)